MASPRSSSIASTDILVGKGKGSRNTVSEHHDEKDVDVEPESVVNEDILRLPESTDEEEESFTEPVGKGANDGFQVEFSTETKATIKRPAPASCSTRSSKRIKGAAPEEPPLIVEEASRSTPPDNIPSSSMAESFLMSSQGSQKRSKAKIYKRSKAADWEDIGPGPETAPKKKKAFEDIGDPVFSSKSHKKKADFVRPPEPPTKNESSARFEMPEFPGDDVFSAQPLPNVDTASSDLITLDTKSIRNRSNSSSSLTSLSSESSAQHSSNSKSRKGRRNTEPEDDPSTVRCPLCKMSITNSTLRSALPKSDEMTINAAKEFCHNHKLLSAKETWKEEAYPEIDWAELADTRIDAQLDHLVDIVRGIKPSYYLTKLDEVIASSKGNKGHLKRYLHEGIVDVARSGYYGPRGQRIVATALPVKLKRELKSARVDGGTLRAVGISAFAVAVLVPETLLRLVMEDLGTDDEVKARKVLDESNDVGMFINPDVDRVGRTEDDE